MTILPKLKKLGQALQNRLPKQQKRKGEIMDTEETEVLPTASPIPEAKLVDNVTKTINFFEALKEISAGKKITKLEWGNIGIYGELADGLVKIKLADGLLHDWIISETDLTGTDYIVIH